MQNLFIISSPFVKDLEMVNKRVRESDLEEVFFFTPLSGNLLKNFHVSERHFDQRVYDYSPFQGYLDPLASDKSELRLDY